MQRRALVNGNAYALIVRSGNRVIRLVPLDPTMVQPRQRNDWSVEYVYTPKGGGTRILAPQDVLQRCIAASKARSVELAKRIYSSM